MKKKIKRKRKNPSKLITNSLIYDLATAFYFGDSLILSFALQQYYQGEEDCRDCDEPLTMCQCEKCEDCGHLRCLCDIEDLKNPEQVSKYAAKFAKNILNDDEWKKFNNSIDHVRKNYKQLYGYYLDEKLDYCCKWWKNEK